MVEEESISLENSKRKRKNKYIPHLAEFYFDPKFNWSVSDARKMYETSRNAKEDVIFYEDCITGMQKLPDESIDLVIADPPFGIKFTGKEAIYNRDESNVVEGYTEIKEKYDEFTCSWINQLPRIMRAHASVYIFSGWTNLKDVLEAIDNAGLIVKNHIIWKYQFGVFTKTKFVSSHYHLLFAVKDDRRYFFHRVQHYNEDVWDIKRTYQNGQEKNGTKLPEDVVQKCIDFSSKPGNLILDPFMGNGTTAIAAKANFRHYIGYEVNNRMSQIIDKNLAQVKIGEKYVPYKERLPTFENLVEEHPEAYKEYLKREGGNTGNGGRRSPKGS